MKHEAWLTCTDPELMLQSVATSAADRRRFALACVRRHRLAERLGWEVVCTLIERNLAAEAESVTLEAELQAALDQRYCRNVLEAIVRADTRNFCKRVGYLFQDEARRILAEIAGETFRASGIAAWTARKREVDRDLELAKLRAQYCRLEEECKGLDQRLESAWQDFAEPSFVAKLECQRDEHHDALRELDDRVYRAEQAREPSWQAIWNLVWDQTWPQAWSRIWREKWEVPPDAFDGWLIECEPQARLAEAFAEAKQRAAHRQSVRYFDSTGMPHAEEKDWVLKRNDGKDLLPYESLLWYRLLDWERGQQARILREILPVSGPAGLS